MTVVAAAIGCGAGAAPVHNVAGNISIDGKPLNQGALIFTDERGEHHYAAIQGDGAFVMPQIAPGLYQASISVPKIKPRNVSKNADPVRGARPLPVPVPNRYASDDTSDLEFTIDEQTDVLSIKLTK
ncbi:hypothetical protein Enr8_26870 [Blastopirellula retiformator]|uniref:Carboxypeptidase regulatory-like domain-containing protein n=2 Tax=Blastopirellula retiformator TaxID=2527970 RepID=A0A5C5V481_9BACT|nr:hypothetical protein Enr8_26870 [Blastopirellula retiformator]